MTILGNVATCPPVTCKIKAYLTIVKQTYEKQSICQTNAIELN